MKPKVSIIIPCYNQACFLPDAINSVMKQTLVDWECIIINDGSIDNSREVAMALVTKENRIRYIEQENRGLSGARNRGLNEARGIWIQFLDADDILLPEKLEKQLDVLMNCQVPALSICDYYFCEAHDVNERITKRRDYEHPRLLHSNPLIDLITRWETDLSIPAHSFLFDARLFTETGINFDEMLPNHEDWDCWMRIFNQQPVIVPLHQELIVYRQHSSSMATNKQAMWRGYEQAINKQIRLFGSNPLIRSKLKKKLAQMYVVYHGKQKNLANRVLGFIVNQLNLIIKRTYKLYRITMPWPIQVRLHEIVSRIRK